MGGGRITDSELEKLFCAARGEEEGREEWTFRIFHEDETLRRGENGDFLKKTFREDWLRNFITGNECMKMVIFFFFSEGFLGRYKMSGIVPLTKSTVQLSTVIQAFRVELLLPLKIRKTLLYKCGVVSLWITAKCFLKSWNWHSANPLGTYSSGMWGRVGSGSGQRVCIY